MFNQTFNAKVFFHVLFKDNYKKRFKVFYNYSLFNQLATMSNSSFNWVGTLTRLNNLENLLKLLTRDSSLKDSNRQTVPKIGSMLGPCSTGDGGSLGVHLLVSKINKLIDLLLIN